MAELKYIVSLVLIVFFVEKADADCPNGFIRHDESCYKFFGTIKTTWAEAMLMCQLFNSKLAIIETAREQNFLEGYLRNSYRSGMTDGVWIDGTDAMVENTWIWMGTGAKIDQNSYQKWYPGEPNHQGRSGEDCLNLMHHEKYNWNDGNCDTAFNFLCERSANVVSGTGVIGK